MNTMLWRDAAEAPDDDYGPRLDDPTDTTPDEDEEAALQHEMMEEAGRRRPDRIDWMRDGDTRHFYDDTLPMGGDSEPY